MASSRSNTIVAVAATALACGLWAVSHHQKKQEQEQQQRRKRQEGCEKVELLPSEQSFVICASVSTSCATFFEASTEDAFAEAVAHFRERTHAITKANPWLLGFLDHDAETGDLSLFVPPTKGASTGDPFVVCSSEDLPHPLPRNDYHGLVTALAGFLCPSTHEALAEGPGKTPLWRIVVAPAPTPEAPHSFCLVVSANHSILDGHGFYRIHNMLSTTKKVEALDPHRNLSLSGACRDAMGGTPTLLEAPTPGFIASFLLSTIRQALFPQTKSMGFVVSSEWIDAQKKAYQESVQPDDDDPPFVSTNDLLVAKFCESLGCSLALMAINLRGRVEGCHEHLLGNYEDLLAYRYEDCSTPGAIRKSIGGPPYQRAGASPTAKIPTELPTNAEHLFGCTYGVTTNWATFAEGLQVPGAAAAKQELHLPLFDFPKACPACTYGSMVVFRPHAGTAVGVLLAGKASFLEAIRASGMVGTELCVEPSS